MKRVVLRDLRNKGSKIAKMGDTFTQVMSFLNSRYRAMYTEQGVSVDTIQAVQAINPHMPLDFDQRIRAVQAFSELSQASMLADSNKRVANILSKIVSSNELSFKSELLQEPAEIALASCLEAIEARIQPMLNQSDYTSALIVLAELRQPIDEFFESVMVMADDEAIKRNRIALLSRLRGLFLCCADIAVLK